MEINRDTKTWTFSFDEMCQISKDIELLEKVRDDNLRLAKFLRKLIRGIDRERGFEYLDDIVKNIETENSKIQKKCIDSVCVLTYSDIDSLEKYEPLEDLFGHNTKYQVYYTGRYYEDIHRRYFVNSGEFKEELGGQGGNK